MVKVSLCCAIVGKVGDVFELKIDDTESDSTLQDAIKAKKPNDFKDIDADKLQLFLAKTVGGAWLDGAGAAAVAPDERGYPQGCVQMDSTLCIKNFKHLGDTFEPAEGEVHVLVVVPKGAPAPENKRKRKRMNEKDAPDAWIQAIKDEQVTELPSTCEDLREHLQRPLHVKVPFK